MSQGSEKAKKVLVMRQLLVLACVLSLPSQALATLQTKDNVRWGGTSFRTPQLPLGSKIQEAEKAAGKLLLKPRESTNLKGYSASWRIDRGDLYLESFHGTFGGKTVPLKTFVDADVLPVEASWYSGVLQLPVGEFDERQQTWSLIIEVTIKKGKVEDYHSIKNGRERYGTDANEAGTNGR